MNDGDFLSGFLLGCIVGIIGEFVLGFWLLQSMRDKAHRRMRR